MDDPTLDAGAHQQALRGLKRINAISGTVRTLWNVLERLATQRGLDTFRVLDVACGGGDLLRGLCHRARQGGRQVEWWGCDISLQALEYARQQARQARTEIEFFAADATREPFTEHYDYVICTLFLHHLDRESSLKLLSHLRAAARHAVLVDDLQRGPLAYAVTWAVVFPPETEPL